VSQGQTLFIRLWSNYPLTIEGMFDDQTLQFWSDGASYWNVVGVPAWEKPGAHPLHIVTRDAAGHQQVIDRTVQVREIDFPREIIPLTSTTQALLAPDLVEAEAEYLATVSASFTPQRRWVGPFLMPVSGRITSAFGTRRSYGGGPMRSYHEGVDLDGDNGTPVRAANSGRVVLAEQLKVRGNTLFIDHGLGVYTGYFHLSRIAVQAEQEVRKGDVIGYVGATGLATGPHLHWELRLGAIQVNPLEWVYRSFPPGRSVRR
jgi:murein DD-endopeptidase MepM/ murein hydrolase activator NlpD